MKYEAATVDEYIAQLPLERQEAISKVRKVLRRSVPKQVEEGIGYGMISYHVPHSVYPAGYHCDPEQPLPFVCLASQKNHMAVYLLSVYTSPETRDEFIEAYKDTGKKLDMGASCVRFKKLEDLPLDLIEKTIKQMKLKTFIENYEQAIPASKRKKK